MRTAAYKADVAGAGMCKTHSLFHAGRNELSARKENSS